MERQKMIKWEYCSVRWSDIIVSEEQSESYSDEEWRKIEEDDRVRVVSGWLSLPGKEQNTEHLHPTLSELGRDGWELVSHTCTSATQYPVSVLVSAIDDLDLLPSGTIEIFYFKRPIED